MSKEKESPKMTNSITLEEALKIWINITYKNLKAANSANRLRKYSRNMIF